MKKGKSDFLQKRQVSRLGFWSGKKSNAKGTYWTRAAVDAALSKSVVALNMVDGLANVSKVEDVLEGT